MIIEKQDKVLLLRRAIPPFSGRWSLPGGHIELGETVEKAAVREASEETGLKVKPLEILGVYSVRGRDPRYRSLTVAFVTKIVGGHQKINYESSETKWFGVAELVKLKRSEAGFDHWKILRDYLKWRGKKRGTYWSTR